MRYYVTRRSLTFKLRSTEAGIVAPPCAPPNYSRNPSPK
jgi:hypothetical protein